MPWSVFPPGNHQGKSECIMMFPFSILIRNRRRGQNRPLRGNRQNLNSQRRSKSQSSKSRRKRKSTRRQICKRKLSVTILHSQRLRSALRKRLDEFWPRILWLLIQMWNESSATVKPVNAWSSIVTVSSRASLATTVIVKDAVTSLNPILEQMQSSKPWKGILSLIHIWRCRRYAVCRSRWSPYH